MAGDNMPREVIFPKVDMDMESGVLSEWLCASGDTVSEGQPIFVIETDKSAMEIEAAASGRIGIVATATGDHYPVGEVMAYIYEPHESFDMAGDASNQKQLEAQSLAPPIAADNPRESSVVSVAGEQIEPSATGVVRASPAARRIAAEYGIALSRVNGSARRGRIVKADVLAQVSGSVANLQNDTADSRAVATGAVATGAVATGMLHPAGGGAANACLAVDSAHKVAAESVKRVPHTQMRRTIASRLTQSVQTIPSYQVAVDCQCESLLRVSQELNSCLSSGHVNNAYQGKVSLNVFFIKALGLALADVPQANCQWTDDATLVFNGVDIGLAVALDGGLITPVIRSVDSKSVLEIASDSRSLIERAKTGSLAKSEYEGGVTTVSNLGMYGIPEFTSIINPPQSSIVSIGTVEQSAVAIDNQLQIKPKCRVTFTFDHRVIDGAVGASVASRFRETVENSVRMLL